MAHKLLLRGGFLALAQRLQEAADASLSAGDLRTRLSDAIHDKFRGSGTWGYYVDHFGDAAAGSVIYSSDGDMRRALYTITENGENACSCAIDFEKSEDVVPRTVYETEVEQREAATVAPGAGNLKLIERYTMAPAVLELIESATGTSNEVEFKVIAPGKGSSAFYPAEVLQREAAKFKKGTQVYINHATEAEESARPEGDWHKLAGAFTSDGYWKESGKQGPGIYAKVGLSADWAPAIKDKAAYSGVSIRANGLAQTEAAGKVVTREGLPVLGEFTSVESVDVVTRAGAGGLILTESARTAGNNDQQQEVLGMAGLSDAEVTEIREALKKANATQTLLLERAVRQDAFEAGARALANVALPDAFKEMAIVNVVERGLPKLDTGALDVTKYGELLTAESKRMGSALAAATGGANVVDMGGAPVEQVDPVVAARESATIAANEAARVNTWARLLPGNDAAAKLAAKGRAN